MWMRAIPNCYNYPLICPYSFLTVFSSKNFPYHYYTYRLFHHSQEIRIVDIGVTCILCACMLSLLRKRTFVAWLIGFYNVSNALYLGDISLAILVFFLIQMIEIISRFIKKPIHVLTYVLIVYSFVYYHYEYDTIAYTLRIPLDEMIVFVPSGWLSHFLAAPRLINQIGITILEVLNNNNTRYPELQDYVERAYNSGMPALDYIGETG